MVQGKQLRSRQGQGVAVGSQAWGPGLLPGAPLCLLWGCSPHPAALLGPRRGAGSPLQLGHRSPGHAEETWRAPAGPEHPPASPWRPPGLVPSLPFGSVVWSVGCRQQGRVGAPQAGPGGGVGRGQEAVLESSVFWGTASDRRPLSPQAIHRARPVPLTTGHGPGKQVAGRQAWLPSVIAEGRVWRLTDEETEAGPIRPPQPRTVPFVPGFGCVLIVLWLGPGRTIG